VPGGVGPMTVSLLMRQTVESCKRAPSAQQQLHQMEEQLQQAELKLQKLEAASTKK
jgi:hypothetical protein